MKIEGRVLEEAEKIFEKNENYQESFKNLMRVIMFLTLAIFVLMCVVLYCIKEMKVQDRYYAETLEGLRMPLVALNDPNVNTEALMTWVEQAAVDILTFGFNDVDQRFAISKGYFSPAGWESFRTALMNSSLLKNMTSYQQIITSIPAAPARLLSSGLFAGKFVWLVEIPVIMTTRAGGESSHKKLTVRMMVARMPTAENPRGVGIEQWISK